MNIHFIIMHYNISIRQTNSKLWAVIHIFLIHRYYWDGPVEEICPGDVIWTQPGERHWHGANPTTGMTHIAIQEHLNGTAGHWLEKVSDEQYRGR